MDAERSCLPVCHTANHILAPPAPPSATFLTPSGPSPGLQASGRAHLSLSIRVGLGAIAGPAGCCSKCLILGTAALPGPRERPLKPCVHSFSCRASVPWSLCPAQVICPGSSILEGVSAWARCRHLPLQSQSSRSPKDTWPLGACTGRAHGPCPLPAPAVFPTIIKAVLTAHLIVVLDSFTVLQLWGRR